MVIKAFEEGRFMSKFEDEEYLSSCFASSVKDICKKSKKGTKVLSLICKYSNENPNDDVLPKTRSLLNFLAGESSNESMSNEELMEVLNGIKNMYFISLPGYTLKRYEEGINSFFDNLELFCRRKL